MHPLSSTIDPVNGEVKTRDGVHLVFVFYSPICVDLLLVDGQLVMAKLIRLIGIGLLGLAIVLAWDKALIVGELGD